MVFAVRVVVAAQLQVVTVAGCQVQAVQCILLQLGKVAVAAVQHTAVTQDANVNFGWSRDIQFPAAEEL